VAAEEEEKVGLMAIAEVVAEVLAVEKEFEIQHVKEKEEMRREMEVHKQRKYMIVSHVY
jgi:hypothetical protein